MIQSQVMTEDEFQILKGGGFFDLILRHPKFEVYESVSRDPKLLVVHIPGEGMVNILVDPCQHKWVDARSTKVESGEFCLLCFLVRSGNDHPDTFIPCEQCVACKTSKFAACEKPLKGAR